MWLSQLLLWYCYFCSPAYSDRRKSLSLPADLLLLIARQGTIYTSIIFFSPVNLHTYGRESELPTVYSGWKNIYYLFTYTRKKRIMGLVWLTLLFRCSFIRCLVTFNTSKSAANYLPKIPASANMPSSPVNSQLFMRQCFNESQKNI